MAISISLLCDRCHIYGPRREAPRRSAFDYSMRHICEEATQQGWTRPKPLGRTASWLCPACSGVAEVRRVTGEAGRREEVA